jgi:2'-5' RNA ligase
MVDLARLSIGYRLPVHFSQPLQELQQTIRRKAIVDMRLTAPTEFVLPILQLGEVSETLIPRLHAILTGGCRATRPINLTLEGLIGLPNAVQPRYVCIGLGGDVDLFEQLHKNIVEALHRTTPLPDGTLYHPMITLGRLRQESEQARVALGRGLRTTPPPNLGAFSLDAIQLLRATAAEGVSSGIIESYKLGS